MNHIHAKAGIVIFVLRISGVFTKSCKCKSPFNFTMAEECKVDGTSEKIYPELIVFDLDNTLWPFCLEATHFEPPFSKVGDKIVDAFGETVPYFSEVPAVLEHIISLHIPMAVASWQNGRGMDDANQLIKLFGWDQYFEYMEIYSGWKTKHFERLQKATGIPYKSMMFFDDDKTHIRHLTRVGVHSVLVRNGITTQLLMQSLEEFSKKTIFKKNKL